MRQILHKFLSYLLVGTTVFSALPVNAADEAEDTLKDGDLTVELTDTENGTVSVDTAENINKTVQHKSGDIVSLFVTPDDGFEIQKIEIQDQGTGESLISSDSISLLDMTAESTNEAENEENDQSVENGILYFVESDDGNYYEFKMPSSDLSVNVTFADPFANASSITEATESQINTDSYIVDGHRTQFFSLSADATCKYSVIFGDDSENADKIDVSLYDSDKNVIDSGFVKDEAEGTNAYSASLEKDHQYYISIGYTDPSLTGKVSFSIKKETHNVHVTYVAGEGGKISTPEETVDINSSSFSGSSALPEEGYGFTGWKDSNGTFVSSDLKFVPKDITGDQEYTAVFGKAETTQHEITFNKVNKVMNAEIDGKIDSIDSLDVSFQSGAVKNENDDFVWNATNSTKGHQFIYRVSFSTSGDADVQPNTIQIRIPKQILKDKNGQFADEFEIGLASKEDVENAEYVNDDGFAYYEEGNELVIYNYRTIKAAVSAYFDVAYATSKDTFEYMDYKADGSSSDPFYAHMTAGEHSRDIESNPVYINTSAEISNTYKYYPTLYDSWNNSWGTKPADADSYYYLVWSVRTQIDSPTQYYNFTLTDTPVTEGVEVVGYKMSGTSVFSDKNTAENQRTSGYRYDTVLTRHPKADYQDLTAYNIENKVTATVTPVDGQDETTTAVGSRTFQWTKPKFEVPIGSFGMRKYGDENEGTPYTSYELGDLQEGKIASIDDIDYRINANGYAFPWTLKNGGTSDDPYSYGYAPVIYVITDETFFPLEADSDVFSSEDYVPNDSVTPLKPEDYDIQYVNYSFRFNDAERDENGKVVFNQETQDFNVEQKNPTDKDVIDFYVKVNNSWIKAASYNLGTNEGTVFDNHVASVTSGKITFNEGVDGIRVELSNNYYYSNIALTPYISIKNTDTVMNWVKDKDAVLLKNMASFNVYASSLTDGKSEEGPVDYSNYTFNENPIITVEKIIGDRLRRVERASEISKKATMYQNNTVTKSYSISWNVYMRETISTGKGDIEPVTQKSGTFYDLLPEGSSLSQNSISVANENGLLSSNQYETETIENYKGSGRTMLIVHVKEPGNYYNLYYDTIHSWDELNDFGKRVINPVAYATGNKDIANGYADTADTISSINKNYMTGLIEGTGYDGTGKVQISTQPDKVFIYDEENYDVTVLTSAVTGLYQKIKAEDDNDYIYKTVTSLGEDYKYKIRYQAVTGTKAKNIVWFESLENYTLDDGAESQWHGTFNGVDVSQLKQKGINPVVYYSTIEDLDLSVPENHDLSNTSVWKKESEITDLSTVKAVAIDASKKTDGTDFVLDGGESVTAYLYMIAPESDVVSTNTYPETYSNVYMQNTILDMYGGENDFYIHHDYTTIKFRVSGGFSIVKENAQDTSEKIKDISFRLTGTSDYGNYVDVVGITDKNGELSFNNIEKGTYILSEYGRNVDWVEDHTEYSVQIDGNGHAFINGTDYTNNPIHITNVPRVHTDIEFSKTKYGTKHSLSSGRFKLSGISDYGIEILKYADVTDGKVKFEDVEKGTYELSEVETEEGYIKPQFKFHVTVDDNANYTITADDGFSDFIKSTADGEITVYNEELHSLTLIKRSSYDGSAIAGTTFNLSGTSDYGTTVNQTVTSGSNGFVEFTNLEPGTYVLQETETPSNFILDNTKRVVSISRNGEATIEGLTPNDAGLFVITNEAIPTGVVKVIKKWNDSDPKNHKDIYPTIHISVQNPEDAVPASVEPASSAKKSNPISSVLNTVGNAVKSVLAPEVKAADNDIASGTSGTVDWVIDTNGKLTLSPSNEESGILGNCSKFGSTPWYSYRSKITSVYADPGVAFNTQAGYLFYVCSNLTTVDLNNVDTSNVTNMSSMFQGCSSLTSLKGLEKWNTGNVTSMRYMFSGCSSLTSLEPLAGWNTGNVTDMKSMFYCCFGFTSLEGLEKWNTGNVTDMGGIFSRCTSLTSIEALSGWNTGNVTEMGSIFSSCTSLTSIEALSGWNTRNVTSISYIFFDCTNLTSIEALSGWNTGNVTNMSYLFYSLSSITSLEPLSGWNTGNVTDMSSMFSGCSSLTSLEPLSGWNTGNVTDMSSMFDGCSSLKSLEGLDGAGWNTGNVQDMSYMFYKCSNITSLEPLSGWNTGNVQDMSYMFYKCSNITSLEPLSGWKTGNVTNMSYLFYSLSSITSLEPLSGWNTGNVTSMGYMFCYCSSLTSLKGLDGDGWNTGNVTSMIAMFCGCSSLTSLKELSEWNTGNVTSMNSMFFGCSSLTSLEGLDGDGWNTGNVTDMYDMFSGCSKLTSLGGLAKWNTGSVANMYSMFYGCSSLESVEALSEWNTGNVTTMKSMFYSCSSLESLEGLEKWDTRNVTNMTYMFYGCSSLKNVYLENWNLSNVSSRSSKYYMFNYCPIESISLPGDFSLYNTYISSLNAWRNNSKFTGKWTYGDPYNHVDAISNDEFTSSSFVPKKGTWYLEIEGEDPTKQSYTSVTDNVFVPEYQENTDGSTSLVQTPEEAFPEDGYWQNIDDNTSIYTFYVYDSNVQWYVWEDAVEGYTSSATIDNPVVITNGTEVATITNTNDDMPTEFGSLSISKQVHSSDGATVSDDSEFAFNITLTDANGAALSGTAVYGNTAFKDGKATVTVQNGETITISDIPAGYHYVVTEQTNDLYESELTNAEGVISANGTASVTAVNTKEVPSVTEYRDLTITKKVTGHYKTSDEYEINVSLSDLEPLKEYSLSDGTTFTSDKEGTADVRVSLGKDESITIRQIPVGASYIVSEAAGDYISSYEITDTNNNGKINQPKAENSEANTELVTSMEKVDSDENVEIVFTNELNKTQDLVLTKEVVDAENNPIEYDDKFEFTISFENLGAGTKILSDAGVFTADDEGKASATILVSNGDEIKFNDLPVGSTYQITEKGNTATASYEILNAVDVEQESDKNDDSNTDLSTAIETVNEGEDATVEFTNTISNGSLKITKQDSSGDALMGAKFVLTNEDGDIMPSSSDKTNGEGVMEWEALPFGTYTLTETEAPSGSSLMTEPVEIEISSENKDVEITIKDNEIIYLETGGAGITWVAVPGMAMILGLFAVYMTKKREPSLKL